jgi:hypothetical protein
MSAPPAAPEIIEPIAAAALALTASSAAFAAGKPSAGGTAAAMVAASATLIAASDVALAAVMAAAAAAGTPRHASLPPMMTLRLPGPGVNIPGSGCTTGSRIRAAGPLGINRLLLEYHPADLVSDQARMYLILTSLLALLKFVGACMRPLRWHAIVARQCIGSVR